MLHHTVKYSSCQFHYWQALTILEIKPGSDDRSFLRGEAEQDIRDDILVRIQKKLLRKAIFNLLPILPFDGGHFILYMVELVSGRSINRKVQQVMMQVGFIILVVLMVFILFVDIFNIFS